MWSSQCPITAIQTMFGLILDPQTLQAHDVPLQSLQNPELDPEYERAKARVT